MQRGREDEQRAKTRARRGEGRMEVERRRTVQRVVERVDISGGVLGILPVKVELELVRSLDDFLLLLRGREDRSSAR